MRGGIPQRMDDAGVYIGGVGGKGYTAQLGFVITFRYSCFVITCETCGVVVLEYMHLYGRFNSNNIHAYIDKSLRIIANCF